MDDEVEVLFGQADISDDGHDVLGIALTELLHSLMGDIVDSL